MRVEQKKPQWVLGVLNLISCIIMSGASFVGYNVAMGYHSALLPFFSYALPFGVIAIFNLIAVVYALKGKHQVLGFTGLGLFFVGIVYFMIMAAV